MNYCKKKAVLSVKLLFVVTFTFCQQEFPTKYFNLNGEEATKEGSLYYQMIREGTDEKDTIVTFYSSNDQLRSMSVTDGAFLNYHENGQLKAKGVRKTGLPIGVVTTYYPNGKIQAEELFIQSKSFKLESALMNYYDSSGNQIIKDGNGDCVCHFQSFSWESFQESGKLVDGVKVLEWTGYNPTLKQKFKELYENGKLISGESYDSLENRYTYTDLEQSPEYKDGLEGMYKVMSKNMRYPSDARKSKIQGAVFVRFAVTGEGSITGIEIVKGISPSCDDEAVRTIKLLKEWIPGKVRGMPVNVKFVLPIKFKL